MGNREMGMEKGLYDLVMYNQGFWLLDLYPFRIQTYVSLSCISFTVSSHFLAQLLPIALLSFGILHFKNSRITGHKVAQITYLSVFLLTSLLDPRRGAADTGSLA
jgi:hypothetical protein